MNLFLLQQYKMIQQIYKYTDYLDVLINIDDFFDILGVYAFPNWLDTQVVNLKFMKYFTTIKLKADIDKVPDVNGGKLLLKYGCKVVYRKTTDYEPINVKTIDDTFIDELNGQRKGKIKKVDCFEITIMIPNKHIINDKIYNLEDMQDLVKEKEEENDELESIVNNS